MSQFECVAPNMTAECAICHQAFSYNRTGPGRPRKMCCSSCRRKRLTAQGKVYRREGRYRERERRNYEARSYERTCVVCETPFTSRWHRAKCCSTACVRYRQSVGSR